MDAVLEVVGLRTRHHAEPGAVDSLRQWSAIHSATSSITRTREYTEPGVVVTSPVSDSALGDEVEEAVEATEYSDVSEDQAHS